MQQERQLRIWLVTYSHIAFRQDKAIQDWAGVRMSSAPGRPVFADALTADRHSVAAVRR